MSSPEEQLAGFRARIDAIDEQMIKLLLERIGVVEQVAALKHKHWPGACHIRPGREGQMHRKIYERFKGSKFSVRAAITLWRQIIGASTHIESPLKVAVLEPEHSWLARGYFGSEVTPSNFSTLAEACAALASGTCNILLLPVGFKGAWWEKLPAESHVFALLPPLEGALPNNVPQALAIAAITPEASGDDVSYYAAGGKLEKRDGFDPGLAGATFLGAHARALKVEE